MRLTVKRRAFGGGDGLALPRLRLPVVACAQQPNADIPGSDPMRTP